MVKRRDPTAKRQPTAEEIEAFASGADGGHSPKTKKEPAKSLDANAKRNYKAISVTFNEFEFLKLEELAKRTGRTKLNTIRHAILKLAEEEKGNK